MFLYFILTINFIVFLIYTDDYGEREIMERERERERESFVYVTHMRCIHHVLCPHVPLTGKNKLK